MAHVRDLRHRCSVELGSCDSGCRDTVHFVSAEARVRTGTRELKPSACFMNEVVGEAPSLLVVRNPDSRCSVPTRQQHRPQQELIERGLTAGLRGDGESQPCGNRRSTRYEVAGQPALSLTELVPVNREEV